MEEMKFEELTELKEPERLLESAMPFQKLIMQYQCALLEVKTKFEVLNHELSIILIRIQSYQLKAESRNRLVSWRR